MAITYPKVIQECLNVLGAVLGATPSAADANYTATPSTSTVIGPDFLASQVQEALAATIAETVEAIASTPLNPERGRFESDTIALAHNAVIPRTDSGGSVIIGVPGRVRDSGNNKPLLPIDADKVRSFVEFASTVYAGFQPYWFAVLGDAILHTRSSVLIRVCTFTRPTSFSGNISLDDWHEGGLVWGTVAKLALKESLFAELWAGADKAWQAHLAQIRSYNAPALYGIAHGAPSTT